MPYRKIRRKKDKKLGETLRKLRETAGLPQWDIADKLAVSRTTYTYCETGKILPDVYSIRFLARFHGMTIEDLLDGRIDQRGYLPVGYDFPDAS